MSQVRFESQAPKADRNMAGWSLANLHLVGYMAKARGISVVTLHDPPLSDPLRPPDAHPRRVPPARRG